jgi:ribosomal protein S18 acetylase RimI-like enzyme
MYDLPPISLRHATLDDLPALRALVDAAARTLLAPDYTPEQIESALKYAMGVDEQLIRDHTYFVAEHAGRIVAAGGWSFRGTLYGNEHSRNGGGTEKLDPNHDAARIRAFFVHPDYARRGIGRTLLAMCTAAAARAGFTRAELAATPAGQRLYQAAGFTVLDRIDETFPDGVRVHGVRMHRPLTPPTALAS